MNKYQKIYRDGIEEKMAELNLEFIDISKDHGDEDNIFHDEVVLKMAALQLAFVRYILEVVTDHDN
jgi:hypothetical protein